MKNKVKISAVLYLCSGIFFIIAALIGKNYVFIPIGCCFIILGIINGKSKTDDDNKGNE